MPAPGVESPVDASNTGREPCIAAQLRGIAISPAPGGGGPVNAANMGGDCHQRQRHGSRIAINPTPGGESPVNVSARGREPC